ncbi:MAG TPA: hypothetical protein PKD79_01985 [Candidatus Doudnabacteria bacterium]|nr:hypothetical protein [Candidatus Doudnabacteria bacterium]
MKTIIIIALLFVLFLPASAQRPGRNNVKKPTANQVVRTTASRSRTPATSERLVAKSRLVEVFPSCTAGSSYLTFRMFHHKVFDEAIRIEAPNASPSQLMGWQSVITGWDNLKDRQVLSQLYEALEPDSIEVYPVAPRYNATAVNFLVLVRQQPAWNNEDVIKVRSILEEHLQTQGFEMSFTWWECILPPSPEMELRPALRILQ